MAFVKTGLVLIKLKRLLLQFKFSLIIQEIIVPVKAIPQLSPLYYTITAQKPLTAIYFF